MSRHAQLVEWAHACDSSPRAFWRRRRGVRHDLEHAAQAEQLELDVISPAAGVSGAGEEARTGTSGVAGKSPSAPGRRPTLDEIRERPWRVFD